MAAKMNTSDGSSSGPHRHSRSVSLLLAFRGRRQSGEMLTARQFIAEQDVRDNPELVVDLAFADFLEAEKNGQGNICERLCQEFPEHSQEIRRQILFHQALARTEYDSPKDDEPRLATGSAREAILGRPLDTDRPDMVRCDTKVEAISGDVPHWLSISGLEMLEPLGRGGMGIVYLAHQPKLNRKVAVKLLLGGMYASAAHRARFRAEAQAAASLRHPNIVQIDEVGEANGQPYLIMELVEGGTLEGFIKSNKPTPLESAEFVLTLAGAIHKAHLRGVIHRDLKPGNIMLAPRDNTGLGCETGTRKPVGSDQRLADFFPKITDFGLAKILGDEQSRLAGPTLTMAGDLLGTPSYMAPEQATGGAIGSWSDVYSIGAILYELLSGRPPFLAATTWETLEQVLNDEPQPLPRSVPTNLRTICMTCLRKDPMSRYTSMNMVASDLQNFLAGKPIAARRQSTWAHVSSWCKRNRPVAALGSTVFLALLTILGLTIWSRAQLSIALSEKESARHGEATAHMRSLSHLWNSIVSQARAQQSTGRVGQRVNSLASVAEAQKLLALVGETPERTANLRDTAAACLPLDDISKIAVWKGPVIEQQVCSDRSMNRVAQLMGIDFVMVTENFGRKQVASMLLQGASRISLSPNGRWLAAWGEECRVYDLHSSPPTITETFSSKGCWGFSNDGNWLVGTDRDGTIIVDLRTHSIAHRVDVPSLTHVPAFSNDNRLVALLSEGSLVVLDIESGKKLVRLNPPVDPHGQQCLAWHPNNRFLAVYGYRNDTVQVWDVASKKVHRSVRQPGLAVSIAFDGPGDCLVTSSSWLGEVNVFDLESEALRLSTRAMNYWMASSPDLGVRMLVSDVGDTKEVLEVRTQKVIRPYHTSRGSKVKRFKSSTNSNGRWSAVSTDRGLELYDNHTKSIIAELPIGYIEFNRVVFDSSDRLWACKEDGLLRWTFDDNGISPPVTFKPPENTVPVNIDHSGSWAVFTAEWQVKLVSLANPDREIVYPSNDVRSVSFSPDGQMLATGEWNGGGGAKVWNIADGKLLAELKTGFYCEVLFSPDGNYLFTSPNGGEIWETASWTKVHRLASNNTSAGGGFAFAFSPDSKWFVNSHLTGQIAIWETRDWRMVSMLRDPEQTTIAGLSFSKDQSELYSISSGSRSTLRSWDLRQLVRELHDIGIDPPEIPFSIQATFPSAPSDLNALAKFTVGRNRIFDELVAKQLALDVQTAFDDNQWLAAVKLYGELCSVRLKNLLRKTDATR
jgi:serine/threonine protein kinase/WD40 repeat protein